MLIEVCSSLICPNLATLCNVFMYGSTVVTLTEILLNCSIDVNVVHHVKEKD